MKLEVRWTEGWTQGAWNQIQEVYRTIVGYAINSVTEPCGLWPGSATPPAETKKKTRRKTRRKITPKSWSNQSKINQQPTVLVSSPTTMRDWPISVSINSRIDRESVISWYHSCWPTVMFWVFCLWGGLCGVNGFFLPVCDRSGAMIDPLRFFVILL